MKIEVPAQSKYLSVIRNKIQPLVKKAGFNEKEVYHIVLAVDEACSNVIRHAYKKEGPKSKDNKICLKVETYKKNIKIKIRDYGIKCNFEKIRGRKLSQIQPGGLGVHLIHGCMDKVVYNTRVKKGTELILTKKLKEKR